MDIIINLENMDESTRRVEEWVSQNGGAWKVQLLNYEDGTLELDITEMCKTHMIRFDVGATISLIERPKKYPNFWLSVPQSQLIYFLG